ncbi:MAG: hypothetical protein OIF56_07805 [Cohaesibacter sp.]|nr:hypothetical protein [Cohaesibacter sp.]
MARRGKAIFDASMIAGWALLAGVTLLLVLTVVSDPDIPPEGAAGDRNALARLDSPSNQADRLVTSSIRSPNGTLQDPATASTNPSFSQRVEENLHQNQNKSFNPFTEKENQQQLLTKLSKQLNDLQRKVEKFQDNSQSLRDENRRLRNRVADLEKMEGRLRQEIATNRSVRVVPLPKRGDSPLSSESALSGELPIDPEATGSIRPLELPQRAEQAFDPFSVEKREGMTLKRQPLNLDTQSSTAQSQDKTQDPLHPKPRPFNDPRKVDTKALSPVSKVVQTPAQIRPTSRTSFALNLGQFISLPELRSAWQEISASQNQLVGDLRPATSIVEAAQNRIQIQLLLGPIQNAAEAATLCVRLKNSGYDCSVSPFQGQALVFNR